ncbi:MAG: 30S ribosome-binding factor RbfA [Bacteroidia bacterium]|nr:30S ribosome-binding factor RbfA [Bacteroidales bacterium]NCD40961.1 30S ribosome-binding factor RbfA [Bacteroidia bacterium]MDD2323930.1 30S ribosome-binding factor RbfA [Bacteroidales bacterium]MDD3961228.1 30S ribosome-binding factor RbfA [Bacteroidales bacterium]MDY0285733.1 30S ribosome-binding factor RbfA [Bacteroidales bacterium]
MENTRQQKIARLVQKDVADIMRSNTKGLLKGAMITITKVVISRDLSSAKIYMSIFGTPQKQELIKDINAHKGEVRYHLAQRIRHQLRVVPELFFYEDDSLDYIDNIERLLNEK